MNALPAILWIIGAACALTVCAVTVYCSHYGHDDVVVKPVRWSVIIGHFATFILLALPYFLYLANKSSISAHSRGLYERLGWPSAIIAIVLVFAELTLMYLQARRAVKFEPKNIAPLTDDDDKNEGESKLI